MRAWGVSTVVLLGAATTDVTSDDGRREVPRDPGGVTKDVTDVSDPGVVKELPRAVTDRNSELPAITGLGEGLPGSCRKRWW